MKKYPKSNKYLLLVYAGFTFQLMALLALATYVGYWLDKWLNIQIWLCVWLLPLIVLIGTLIKVIKDTSTK